MHGEVALPPFPAWVAGEAALTSVAELQRQLHDASRSYHHRADAVWYRPNLPPPAEVDIVCHNDLCVENVVFHNGRATAFIDFDFAAPADPLLDIAIACRHWVPLKDPIDVVDGFADVDQGRRFILYCDAYGVERLHRQQVLVQALDFLDRALVTMRAKADEGLTLYVAAWENGYEKQNRRSHEWLRRFSTTISA
jgi:aminoglycoside phosphotransferase (APT) family kinase protein